MDKREQRRASFEAWKQARQELLSRETMRYTFGVLLVLLALTQFPEAAEREPGDFAACVKLKAVPLLADIDVAQAVYACADSTNYTGSLQDWLP